MITKNSFKKRFTFILLLIICSLFISANDSSLITVKVNTKEMKTGNTFVIFVKSTKKMKEVKAKIQAELKIDRQEVKFYNIYGYKLYRGLAGFDIAMKSKYADILVEAIFEDGSKAKSSGRIQIEETYETPESPDDKEKIKAVVKLPEKVNKIYEQKQALKEERQLFWRVLAQHTPNQLFSHPFGLPAKPRKGAGYWPFGWPRKNVVNGKVSWSYHRGVDIANKTGTPIWAANSGVVAISGDYPARGGSIAINHGCGIYSNYFHLSKRFVKAGEKVKKGQVIAYMGSTGISTGSHLHWEIRVTGISVNPYQWTKPFMEYENCVNLIE